MNLKRLLASLFSIIGIVLILGGCGAADAPFNSSGPVGPEAQQMWSDAVTVENQMSALYATIETDLGSGYNLIQNENPEIDRCYSNYKDVETAALKGQYDNNVGNKPSTNPSINSSLILQSLKPISVGDVARCQQLEQKLVNDITVWRTTEATNFRQLWDVRSHLNQVEKGNINMDMKQELLKIMIEKMPADSHIPQTITYLFPTFNLNVVTRNQSICDFYHDYKRVDYCDWNPALKDGTLIAMAALDYMSRPFVPAQVSSALDCGNDNLNPLATPSASATPCK